LKRTIKYHYLIDYELVNTKKYDFWLIELVAQEGKVIGDISFVPDRRPRSRDRRDPGLAWPASQAGRHDPAARLWTCAPSTANLSGMIRAAPRFLFTLPFG
jgi:hypothetical protein